MGVPWQAKKCLIRSSALGGAVKKVLSWYYFVISNGLRVRVKWNERYRRVLVD